MWIHFYFWPNIGKNVSISIYKNVCIYQISLELEIQMKHDLYIDIVVSAKYELCLKYNLIN